jgi:hypothetical protein
MGFSILSVTLGALLLVGIVDLFNHWYGKFLKKRPIAEKTKIILGRIFWAAFALTFWAAMLQSGLPEKFNKTYYLFVLFIYSIRGLFVSFITRKEFSKSN